MSWQGSLVWLRGIGSDLQSLSFGGINGSGPLNSTWRHTCFLNLIRRHGHFLKSTCDMDVLVTYDI